MSYCLASIFSANFVSKIHSEAICGNNLLAQISKMFTKLFVSCRRKFSFLLVLQIGLMQKYQ